MIEVILSTPSQEMTVQTTSFRPCTHSRIVDEVRTLNGARTGQLICIECLAQFPDPLDQERSS
jgi:hypothetical protein